MEEWKKKDWKIKKSATLYETKKKQKKRKEKERTIS
jgi:hypothetical protein